MKWFRTRNNINFFFYLIIMIIFLFKFSLSYIVLPFKFNTPPKTSNMTELVNYLVDNKLIITLLMGNPKTNIDFYASMNLYLHYLEEDTCLINSSSKYIPSNSNSYIHKKNLTFCSVKLDICSLGQDILYLYEDIDLKKTTEFSPFIFYIGKQKYNINNNKGICGKIGFQIDNAPYKYYEYDNFIKSLKKYNKIESYSWYIHYYEKPYKKNENEYYDGAIIFDIYHKKFLDDFSYIKYDNEHNTINAKDLEAILAWTFSFDKIYYNINDMKIEINNKESGLAFESDFVLCPEGYFESIKSKFFDYFFKNNICFLGKGKYNYIYCDKNKFQENVIIFPELIFKNNGLNKTFVLTGEDLFREYNNYLLFMILFKEYSYKLWTLGKIFMKKYHFYFDSDKKIIGCFEKNNKSKENSFINFIKKIKWYLFIFIGVIIGFAIGKKIREKARKLRANELEDKFEYLENKANDKDINNSISNYKAIKSQLFDVSQEENIN